VACVIPAYNAAATVAAVVSGLRSSVAGATIIGVNDGSSDETRAILDGLCDRTISFPANRGKGAALRAGFETALSLGSDSVLALDADGQHDPAYAPRLLDALTDADVVVGTRVRGGDMPTRRRVTNALSAAAARRLGRCEIPDPQSGFRALRSTVLRAIRGRGDRYEYETDLLLLAARAGFRIASVPVPTIYGPMSHFREVSDGLRIVAMFCRHLGGRVS
jgi:glycosyltransferase involved in cell wall biosynthesis